MNKSLILLLVVLSTSCLAIDSAYSCQLLPKHDNHTIGCMPHFPHLELGHAYQNNYNRSVLNTTEFQNLDQFALTYFTQNKCVYYQDFTVDILPVSKAPGMIFYENFTDAYDGTTCNVIKFKPSNDDLKLSYKISSDQFTCRKHKMIRPRIFEEEGESYKMCFFNNVNYLDNSIECNMAQIFHYSAKQLFSFFKNSSFQGFIVDHAVHAISNLGDQDWDFPPFGSKQWYFNFNYMFQMTLDIFEESTINDIFTNFQNVLPVVQQYRKTLRPWFVSIASQSPYQLDQTGKILINEAKYGAIYDNLKANKFDALITSHPSLSEVKIFISKDYRTFYEFEVTHSAILLNQFDGFVVVYLPTYLDTPAILKTSFKSFKLYLEEEKILQINNC
ncbi:hypothetical protein ABPG74_006958 [Tetrahymena malaccensis]